MNAALENTVASLAQVLRQTLNVDDYLDFKRLKEVPNPPPFDPGSLGLEEPLPPLVLPTYSERKAPRALMRLIPGTKRRYEQRVAAERAAHEEAVATAEQAHRDSVTERDKREEGRLRLLAKAKEEHEEQARRHAEDVARRNQEIDELERRFEANDSDAVSTYFSLVLDSSMYPPGFPNRAKVAWVPESKQLVVERDLPTLDIVPEENSYRYVKAKDEVAHTTRPASHRKSMYSMLISEIALRTLHELFEADRGQRLETIVFNGMVDTTDIATGKPIRPCLVTVRTTRGAFLEIDLANVEPLACLRALNAAVSRSPSELVPVRPILEFNMVDSRYVQEADVLSSLDQRPNLMELTPSEFESLITNLFEKMGLETRLTQASRDGGVDCVAYDQRPILGGKVVIQAKRYKNTVGVSAVRDLFGTMQNEGASKGILVTTSGYGKASFDFADGKPIELLSGSELLYLLSEHAGLKAKIEVPDDWEDPSPYLDE